MPRHRRSYRRNRRLFSSSELFLVFAGAVLTLVITGRMGELPDVSIPVLLIQFILLAAISALTVWGAVSLIRFGRRAWYIYQDVRRYQGYHSVAQVDSMDHVEFERFVGHVLRNEGCTDVEPTRITGDGGIDLYMKKDEKRLMVQVKHYKVGNNIGAPALRDFVGAFVHTAQGGWFVTTSDYTAAAREYASKTPNLRLINRNEFDEMMGRLSNQHLMDDFTFSSRR